ncbi:hypothetical protein [Bacteroides mediterraneensis]|uniref:hypothetical protein n=1 Tax=Bacteroides mediterraneensis TaxID=1841856 RepID=UPI00195A388A|nr:hypothetical protein [Bacteroides mediterraneensis]MBM6782252.1 hypothetical protein [Bacteroides mediterraneensis]
MNKAILSVWKKFQFKHNIKKIRTTIVSYLTDEGIQNEIVEGNIQFTYEDYKYSVEFRLNEEYPCCYIDFQLADEDYQKLNLSQKTFIADKVNTDEIRHAVVKCFNDQVTVDTHFYFTNKDMLLTLFYTYFTDLKSTVDAMLEITIDKIQENEGKKPIGFSIPPKDSKAENAQAI